MTRTTPVPLSILSTQRVTRFLPVLVVTFLFPVLVYAQSDDTWLGGTGNWSDPSKWSAGVPTGSSNVFIDNGNGKASAVTVDLAGAVCGNLTIDSDDVLTIPSGSGLIVNGTSITNNGKINITDNPTYASLSVEGSNVTLNGGGTITLTDTLNTGEAGLGGATLTNASTIQGSGTIEFSTLVNQAGGVINANQSGLELKVVGGGVSNRGILEASSSLLELGTVIDNTGGTITGNGGLVFNNGRIVGGTLTSTGNGSIGNFNPGLIEATKGNVLTISGVLNNYATIASVGSGSKVLVTGTILNSNDFRGPNRFKVGCGTVFQITGTFANFSGTTLSGGHYLLCGTLQFNGANIVTNAADIRLTGPSSAIVDLANNDGLRNLAALAKGGNLDLFTRKLATAGNFSSAGKLLVDAASTFTINGSLTLTRSSAQVEGIVNAPGGTTVLHGATVFGKGTIASAVNSSGTTVPGENSSSPGTLSVSAYTQNHDGTLDVCIKGTNPGTQYSVLAATNGASLNGVLNINSSPACFFIPPLGNTFSILSASAITGQFSTVNGLSINGNEHYQVNYNPNKVTLTVVSGP